MQIALRLVGQRQWAIEQVECSDALQLITSKHALPPRMVMCASLAVLAGSAVKIVDRHKLPLKSFDPDLVQLLVTSSQAAGIEFLPESEATSIVRKDGRLILTVKTNASSEDLTADLVVNCSGRMPNLDGMNLEAGHVAYGNRGITVNQFLQSTTNPLVYAAGDCADTGVPMLTPTANKSARSAAANLLAGRQSGSASHADIHNHTKERVDYGPVPQVVFSVPPLAAVGLSEAEAIRLGYKLDVRFEDMSTKGEVRKLCCPAAGCKVIVDRKTDQILGAHILGFHAEDVINFFALAIRFNLKLADVKSTLLSYPTMTSEFCRIL